MAFARAIGEYGSVIFIAGNMPMVSEITPLVIIGKLEQYDYAGATAVAVVMLVVSFVLLLVINACRRGSARAGRGGMSSCSSRRPLVAHHRSAPGCASLLIGAGAGLPAAVPGAAAGGRVHRGAAQGLRRLLDALAEPDAWSAIRLTLITAAIAVPLEPGLRRRRGLVHRQVRVPRQGLPDHAGRPAVLGVAGGRRPDLRAAVRRAGLVRPWLAAHDIKIIFAVPGIVLATIFVTFPFVARELIPLMQAQGNEEEEAAIVLGASGWQTFWRVTLPNIKWGLLYGVILCNARAMGEFGAVSVVSGHIRGQTNTMPLHVEILYNEYKSVAAFAVASLLALLALVTLVIKSVVEWRHEREMKAAAEIPPERPMAFPLPLGEG